MLLDWADVSAEKGLLDDVEKNMQKKKKEESQNFIQMTFVKQHKTYKSEKIRVHHRRYLTRIDKWNRPYTNAKCLS